MSRGQKDPVVSKVIFYFRVLPVKKLPSTHSGHAYLHVSMYYEQYDFFFIPVLAEIRFSF